VWKLFSTIATLFLLFCSITAEAGPVSLPPVNLGDTSFQDGIANPGWLLESLLTMTDPNRIKLRSGLVFPPEGILYGPDSIARPFARLCKV
jgi:hypothetical protein